MGDAIDETRSDLIAQVLDLKLSFQRSRMSAVHRSQSFDSSTFQMCAIFCSHSLVDFEASSKAFPFEAQEVC